MSIKETVKYILAHIHDVRKVIDKVYFIKDDLIELTLSGSIAEIDFYHITSLLTPQSRSPLWEKFYIKKHNATKISAQTNKGDFMLNETAYEYKASGFNVNDALHVVQIRVWQECDYIVQSIQYDKVYTFRLTHAQMEKEIKLCKASSAHGTLESNKNNQNVEMRFTIYFGSEDWKRWLSRYQL